MEAFLDYPHILMTLANGSLCNLPFSQLSQCFGAPGNFMVGVGEGHCHTIPMITIVIRSYPLSFYGHIA